MDGCPLCEAGLSDAEFHAILLEDRHGIGEPPADATNWTALRRTLREEHDLDVSVTTLMAHADDHIDYM